MLFLCLVILLQANPRHTPKPLFPGHYSLFANFQLDSLANQAQASLIAGEDKQDLVIQLQALQLIAEVQIAENQFDQAYATLHSAHQLSPDHKLPDHKLYLAGALSEVALLAGNTNKALEWRQAYLKDMQSQGQCEKEEPVIIESGPFQCERRSACGSSILELCLHEGGHIYRAAWIERSWGILSDLKGW